jgi:hypothetical protein
METLKVNIEQLVLRTSGGVGTAQINRRQFHKEAMGWREGLAGAYTRPPVIST